MHWYGQRPSTERMALEQNWHGLQVPVEGLDMSNVRLSRLSLLSFLSFLGLCPADFAGGGGVGADGGGAGEVASSNGGGVAPSG
jgi:hypothetical protein